MLVHCRRCKRLSLKINIINSVCHECRVRMQYNVLAVLGWVIVFLILLTTKSCQAEEFDPVRAFTVVAGLVTAPMALASKDLPMMHLWEIEGLTYGATDLGFRFLPKDIKAASPFLVSAFCVIYRALEIHGDQKNESLYTRKLGGDFLGVIGRVCIDL